ncbi:MAG: SiaB family protein kinase [Candidatus Competibacter sp.]|nr:SiaB family protein kinase [Candidatus Competibacter sp.]MDG4584497.1 SiaB family protein kinase [Candidatus Competibacter sp.]
MDNLDLVRLQEELSAQGILMSFSGPFSHSIIEELGVAVKNYLESAQVARPALMDVFAVYIEQAQNVRNYIDRREQGPEQARLSHSGIVVVARKDGRYVVSSGNLVDRVDAPSLVAHLERLRALDKAGLKALYKQRMREPLSDRSGAGLGLIDMARKAAEPLDYGLSAVDEQYMFFSLRVMI